MCSIAPTPEQSQTSCSALGATYHTGSALDLDFDPDIIIECTGVGSVIGDSIQKVGSGGIICLTGVGSGGVENRAVGDIAKAVVLKNNLVVGSVNANKRHWYRAGQNLAHSDREWLSRLTTASTQRRRGTANSLLILSPVGHSTQPAGKWKRRLHS